MKKFMTLSKFYSSETVLLKLTNHIMKTTDSGKNTMLIDLDMIAAFDTLNHITLLYYYVSIPSVYI